jgi:hypothetical protein
MVNAEVSVMPKGSRLFWTALLALAFAGAARVFGAPVNDSFAEASNIPAGPTFVSGTTAGAGAEPGEGLWGTASVWYKWVPDQSSGWEVSYVAGLNGDSLLVFAGESFQTFQQVGFAMGEFSQSLWVEAGKTYYIRVEAGRIGGNTFTLRFNPGPVNDGFAGRVRLPASEIYEASMFGASIESWEPDYGPMQGRSLWWEWTAPETASYYFSVPYSDFGPWMSVFQGNSITFLTRIPTEIVNGTDGMQTVFRAKAGETYVLRVTAVTFEKGVVRFGLHRGPSNDEWETAAPLGNLNDVVQGNTTGSTYQPGEVQRHEHGGGSVWYWWEAPATGAYVARSFSELGEGEIHVYRGSSLATLLLVEQAERSYNPPGEYLVPFRAVAGEKLYLSVDPAGLSTGPFTISVVKPAANDDFAAAERLEGSYAEAPWRNFLATVEPNEPQYAGVNNIGSLWWRWVATTSGTYLVHSEHDVKPVGLGIYTGASLATLTKITAQTNRANQVYVGFYAEPGREYYIHLAQDAATSEPVRVLVEPGVFNDDIAHANNLVGAPATEMVPFRMITQEPDEPLAFVDKGTLWWKWTAPASRSYIFSAWSTLWESGQVEIAVFAGATRAELRLIGRATRQGSEAALTFRATAGEVFHFVVAERPVTGMDQAYIRASIDPGPANDDFANATPLTGELNFAIASTRAATREPAEPNHGQGASAGSVWFKWTAPFTGKVFAGIDSSSVSGKVYRGSTLQNLEAITSGTISASDLTLNVIAGVEYFFALESSPELPLTFHLRLGKAPGNDNYVDRERIEEFGMRYRSWTVFAGIENGEGGTSGRSVWWTWTAPQDGIVTMQTEASGTIARPEIYYQDPLFGSPVLNSQNLAALLVSPTNRAAVVAGRTYDIRLVTPVPSTSVGLILNFIPAPETNVWSDDSFLRGGTALWTEETNVVHSAPTATQPGPGPVGESSWIQRTIVGSGRLSFWWRRSGDQLRFEVRGLRGRPGYVLTQQPSSMWSRMEVPLYGTNVVRWTAQKFSFTDAPPAVYLDDVVFTPYTATLLSPRLNSDGSIGLTLVVDFGNGHHLWKFETSDDLRTWTAWTNRFVDNVTTNAYELRVTDQPSVSDRQKFFRVMR